LLERTLIVLEKTGLSTIKPQIYIVSCKAIDRKTMKNLQVKTGNNAYTGNKKAEERCVAHSKGMRVMYMCFLVSIF
jgi:hypothetical protein